MLRDSDLDAKHFEDWMRAYGRAWEAGDPDAAAALFTTDAAYHETPFDAPMVGSEAIHRYWQEGASQGQRNVRFNFTILALVGRMGISTWRATFERVPSGTSVQLDGILTAEFASSGRCHVFREWWHRMEAEKVP